jgi:hypothetical protein
MQQYYTIDDITISKWAKKPDGTYLIRISSKDGFTEDIPPEKYAGISDSTTVEELKAILKQYIESIVTIDYSLRNNVELVDMLADNNQTGE